MKRYNTMLSNLSNCWSNPTINQEHADASKTTACMLQQIIKTDNRVDKVTMIKGLCLSYLGDLKGPALRQHIDLLLHTLGVSFNAHKIEQTNNPKTFEREAWGPLYKILKEHLEAEDDCFAQFHGLQQKTDSYDLPEEQATRPMGGPSAKYLTPLAQHTPKTQHVVADLDGRSVTGHMQGARRTVWRHQNRLSQTAEAFLRSEDTNNDTENTSIPVPCFVNAHQALRPLPSSVPQPHEALQFLAEAVKAGKPGSLIEAEAFAFIYNLPAKLWKRGNPCQLVFTLREGDHNENYGSQPLHLVDCGGGAWGFCDHAGRLLSKPYEGADALYAALQKAALFAARKGIETVIPQSIATIRTDVARRFLGEPAKTMRLDSERNAAMHFFRTYEISHSVHVTRHDPSTRTDYITPPVTPQPMPKLGLVHRAHCGWSTFLVMGPAGADNSNIDANLVGLPNSNQGSLSAALTTFISILGRNDSSMQEAIASILDSVNKPLPATLGILSETYTEWVIKHLRDDFDSLKTAARAKLKTATLQLEQVQKAAQLYAEQMPYKAFTSAAQEKLVKRYLAYLGSEKRFAAQISIIGLSEVIGRQIRVWTTSGKDAITLEPQNVYGVLDSKPVDIYRVGAHYQYLVPEHLAKQGVKPTTNRHRIVCSQLGYSSKLPIEEVLLQAGVAKDVGGDGNCQFLVMAYASNRNNFASIDRLLEAGKPVRHHIIKTFADEPALQDASENNAVTYLRERTAQELRCDLIDLWISQLKTASYQDAQKIQNLVTSLETAAHDEASEVLGKVTSNNPSFSWAIRLDHQEDNTLRQRLEILEFVMAFCPQSDEVLWNRGMQLLNALKNELEQRSSKKYASKKSTWGYSLI